MESEKGRKREGLRREGLKTLRVGLIEQLRVQASDQT
jgi:hypothetical protein